MIVSEWRHDVDEVNNRNYRNNRNNRNIVSSERNNKSRLVVSESRHDVNEVNKRFREISYCRSQKD
ncbi:MAG: hypothetical protein IJT11_09340 [Bacteroidaceae bacterium]|nr:hypothetical protein [Bacteroidaceae bacterium]